MGVRDPLVIGHHLTRLVLYQAPYEAVVMLALLDDTQREPARAAPAEQVAQRMHRRRGLGLVRGQQAQRRGVHPLHVGPSEGKSRLSAPDPKY